MAFNITKKFAGGVAGSALLMFGAATAAGSAVAATPPQTAGADPSATTHVVNDQEVLARLLDQGDAPYVRLANVEGAFDLQPGRHHAQRRAVQRVRHGAHVHVLQARRRAGRIAKAAWPTST